MRVRSCKHQCLHRGPVPRASRRHERLSMDFVHNQLLDGRQFRIWTVLDQWSREALIVEPSFSYSGVAVARLLEEWGRGRQIPPLSPSTKGPSSARKRWSSEPGNTA